MNAITTCVNRMSGIFSANTPSSIMVGTLTASLVFAISRLLPESDVPYVFASLCGTGAWLDRVMWGLCSVGRVCAPPNAPCKSPYPTSRSPNARSDFRVCHSDCAKRVGPETRKIRMTMRVFARRKAPGSFRLLPFRPADMLLQ